MCQSILQEGKTYETSSVKLDATTIIQELGQGGTYIGRSERNTIEGKQWHQTCSNERKGQKGILSKN